MRILIAIGCNKYDNVSDLSEAELDAHRIFNSLTRAEVGEYSVEHSRLLLSPTLDDIRKAIRQAFFIEETIQSFTFFFAGHGCVQSGSFYMLPSDTQPQLLSMTGFSLAELFRGLNEKAPSQSNIIIDACESGGLIADLGTLLKVEMLGDAGTPCITLVATSAQNQTANEDATGGIGTNAILDCIEGRDFVQDNASVLDLVEIGRRVSSRLQTSGQTPVVWGLNLYGPASFCKNPYFNSDPARPLRELIHAASPVSDASIHIHYHALWRSYLSISENWKPRAFAKVIDPVIASLAVEPSAVAAFITRFGTAILERTNASKDPFRRSQVAGVLAASLLPYLRHEVIARAAKQIIEAGASALLATGKLLLSDIAADRYALLTKQGLGFADLFYLPLRVSKTLGWIAALPDMFPEGDSRRCEAEELFREIFRTMLAEYSGSIIAISDAQAPYWLVTVARAIRLGLNTDAEELVGLIFHSFVACKGHLARFDISSADILGYLLARQANDWTQTIDLIERPCESLTFLLKAAQLLDLGEAIDDDLWQLDGEHMCAYINSDFSQFAREVMTGGNNFGWKIGEDIFRTQDIANTWPNPAPQPSSALERSLAIAASLLYPDRVAWFCLDGIQIGAQ